MNHTDQSREGNREADDRWTVDDVPRMDGKVALITGGGAIATEVGRVLVDRGADVVFGCGDDGQRQKIRRMLASEKRSHAIDVRSLKLGNLESVAEFGHQVCAEFDRLDVLCNLASVVAQPRRETDDGFELHIGFNHLGHFALTGHLSKLLGDTAHSRVVTVSSNAHKMGGIRFDDLHWRSGEYSRWEAYGQSKLANLLFTHELQRRFAGDNRNFIAVSCHLGLRAVELGKRLPNVLGQPMPGKIVEMLVEFLGKSATAEALPLLYAATSDELEGGEYVSPSGFGEAGRQPVVITPSSRATDDEAAEKLWTISRNLTGVEFDLEMRTGSSA